MPRRRALILCYFFPPLAGGGVHRVLSFVKHLPAHGWDCTVVCAGEHDYWVTDESLIAEVPANTEVIRVARRQRAECPAPRDARRARDGVPAARSGRCDG